MRSNRFAVLIHIIGGHMFTYKGYTYSSHFDEFSDTFYGKIVGISDFVNFESDTVEGLQEEFIKAVDDYIETRKDINKMI